MPTIEWGKGEMIKCECLLTRLLVQMFSRYWDTSDTRDWGWEKRTRCKTALLIYFPESHQLAYLLCYWVILKCLELSIWVIMIFLEHSISASIPWAVYSYLSIMFWLFHFHQFLTCFIWCFVWSNPHDCNFSIFNSYLDLFDWCWGFLFNLSFLG